jgi:antirestriction protein ArdC
MSLRDGTAEVRERLVEAVERMADSDTFVAWLRARATFHDYSLSNSMLIATQRPDATHVAGFKTWRSLGRQVRRGERGIRILAPCVRRVDDEGTGQPTRRVVSFRCVCVFDVAQTDGDDLPALEYRPLDGDATDWYDFVGGVAMSAGLEIRRAVLTDGVHGYLSRAERSIVVDCEQSGAMAAKVVAHELGHYFDPWLAEHPEQYGAHRGDCEAVAESVAFVVAASFGLDAGPAAVGYVAAWLEGDAGRVRDLAERIDAGVAAILGTHGRDEAPTPT